MAGEEKKRKEIKLALAEIGITSDGKKAVGSDLLNTRESLIAALHKLGQSRDIDGILEVERGILVGERKYLATEPETIRSLNTAIEQIDAAIKTLAIVRDPDRYRVIDENLSISKNRVGPERLQQLLQHKGPDLGL